jgi:acyl-CoA thioesterase FadM
MPFDTILVTLSFQEIAKNQIVLRYEYFRELDNGNKEKLAIGQHTSSWVTHTEDGKAEFSPIPDEIMTALLGTVDFSQHKISA